MTNANGCPACGSSVAVGRLSCPNCGAILAAVRGGPREARPDGLGRAVASGSSAEAAPTQSESPGEGSSGEGAAAPVSAASVEQASAQPEPAADAASDGAESPSVATEDAWLAATADAATEGGPSSAPTEPAVPGSYLPPSDIYPPPRGGPSWLAPRSGTGGEAPATASPQAVSSGPAPRGASAVRSGPGDSSGPGAGERSSALTLRPLGAPAASWLVVAGSTLGLVAFLLPWSPNGVIGSPGDAGYLGHWGLANGAYLLVMAAAFGCLAVQLVETRLPRAVRDGVLPLGLGGFLLGLAWTYVAGPFGADLGVQATIVGGVLLLLGGGLGVRAAASRSVGPPAS